MSKIAESSPKGRPTLAPRAEIRPTLGQFWPMCAMCWPTLAYFGKTMTELDQNEPSWAKSWRRLVDIGKEMTELQPTQSWPTPGPKRPDFMEFVQNLGPRSNFWTKVGQLLDNFVARRVCCRYGTPRVCVCVASKSSATFSQVCCVCHERALQGRRYCRSMDVFSKVRHARPCLRNLSTLATVGVCFGNVCGATSRLSTSVILLFDRLGPQQGRAIGQR